MTNREMFTAIVEGKVTDEVVEKAREEIAKLDKRNADRKGKESKKALENKPIIEAITKVLTSEPKTASEIAAEVEISVQKASALLRQIDGLTVTEVKVPKKGKCKGYAIA